MTSTRGRGVVLVVVKQVARNGQPEQRHQSAGWRLGVFVGVCSAPRAFHSIAFRYRHQPRALELTFNHAPAPPKLNPELQIRLPLVLGAHNLPARTAPNSHQRDPVFNLSES